MIRIFFLIVSLFYFLKMVDYFSRSERLDVWNDVFSREELVFRGWISLFLVLFFLVLSMINVEN